MPKRYAVYILTNRRNGTLYVGVTGDLAARIDLHRSGAVPGFSKDHDLHRLVHVEYFLDIEEAILREKRVKRWRRKWKLELIEKANPYWNDLSDQV
jgi:putative endonuclease